MSGPDDTVRVVICEDSGAYAAALTHFLEADGDLRVVAHCLTGEELIARLPATKADIVTMDLDLPGIDGNETVRRIMRTDPLPIIALSDHTPRGSRLAAVALGAGALDAISKDDIRLQSVVSASGRALRKKIKRLARARVNGSRSVARAPRSSGGRELAHAARASVVAVCASTGGPAALRTVLDRLPGDYPLPVLVVQHMTQGFTKSFATWLDETVPVPVRLAVDGDRLAPGVWVAPDDSHLLLDGAMRMRLDRKAPANPHRPSADALLESVASSAGSGATAVVLTGMGHDGGRGTALVGAAGGLAIAQDEATSAIYGMPRAAKEAGADLVLPLDQIGDVLAALVERRASVR